MGGMAVRKGNVIELDLATEVALTQLLNSAAFANAHQGRYYRWGAGGEIYKVTQSRNIQVGTLSGRGSKRKITTADPTLRKDIKDLLFQKPMATLDSEAKEALTSRLIKKGYRIGSGPLTPVYKRGKLSHYARAGPARKAVYDRVLVGTIRKKGNRYEFRSMDTAFKNDSVLALKMLGRPEKSGTIATATR